MKKIFYSLMVAAVAAFTFTSCEDVPMPYDQPGTGGGEVTTIDPTGTGTAADPYNIAALNEYAKTLAQGESSPEIKYFRGKVVSFKSGEEPGNSYGNSTFYLSDDGTSKNQFYVYRCKGPGNTKITDANLFKEGDELVVCGTITNYNGTLETEQNTAYIVSINGTGNSNTGGGSTATASGTGTQSDPYNVAKANEVCAALQKSSTSASYLSDEVYVKGKICSITDTELSSFGNITYYISDDGTTTGQLEVYRGFGINGAKFTALTDIKVGDEVVIKGKLQNWLGTYEFTQGSSLVSINGSGSSTGGGDTGSTVNPKGTGTQADPFNIAAAIQKAQETGETETATEYYIKGKVLANSTTDATITTYGNMTFTMVDEGTTSPTFTAFQVYGPNKEKFTSVDQIKPGQTVVVCGKIVNYKGNTPETVGKGASYVVSIDGEGTSTGGGDNTGGEEADEPNSITILSSSFGLENGAEVGTQTLSDGTTLTFDKGTNSNAPKYYNSGTNIRMYPTNTLTITATKKITKVVINCDTYNGTLCNAGGEVSITPGSLNVNNDVLSFSNINNSTATITNTSTTTGAGSQIRIVSMKIVYAE